IDRRLAMRKGKRVVLRMKRRLVPAVSEYAGEFIPGLACVLAPRIRILAHQCVVVATLKILVCSNDFVSLARDIRLEDLGCNRWMILDRYYLSDVVTQRGDDHLLRSAIAFGTGCGLQSMKKLV